MKFIKPAILSATAMLGYVLPQISYAHSTSSFASQMLHNVLHAHHAFGGLLFIAVVVTALKVRKNLVAKRIQQKR